MVVRHEFCLEFARGIYGWINVSPESLLRVCQGTDHILKGRVPHDEQVDVACRSEFASGGGSKHKGDHNPLTERGECIAEDVGQAGGLGKQALQLGKDRRLAVGLEVDLAPLDRTPQDARGRQQLQLTL